MYSFYLFKGLILHFILQYYKSWFSPTCTSYFSIRYHQALCHAKQTQPLEDVLDFFFFCVTNDHELNNLKQYSLLSQNLCESGGQSQIVGTLLKAPQGCNLNAYSFFLVF